MSVIKESQENIEKISVLIIKARDLTTGAADILAESVGFRNTGLKVSQFAQQEDIKKIDNLRKISNQLYQLYSQFIRNGKLNASTCKPQHTL